MLFRHQLNFVVCIIDTVRRISYLNKVLKQSLWTNAMVLNEEYDVLYTVSKMQSQQIPVVGALKQFLNFKFLIVILLPGENGYINDGSL